MVEFAVHVRPLGRPAASGAQQFLCTFPTRPAAQLGLQIAWRWWTICSPAVDPQGWRNLSCRWWAS